ncbi:MAG: pantetheine-phosphate adenylyltransferase [Succinivibrio sp.]|nr:pantetheine-phosphate adenylyltransferase [Succinivibrio sp.]
MAVDNLAVFPGTFDPFTLGHFDILMRASRIFSKVLIAVAENPAKHTLFSLEERVSSIKEACLDIPSVEVTGFSGMLVDLLREYKADILVRGVRTVADYDYEVQLSGMYRTLMPDMEIVMLPTSGSLSFISSTLVRDVIIHHGDSAKFVPASIQRLIKRKFS